MTTLTLELGAPPSANVLYVARGRGRCKSSVYQRWIRASRAAVVEARGVGLWSCGEGPYAVELLARIDRRRDLDNIAKPVLDLLVVTGCVPDDRWCDELVLRRCAQIDPRRVRVTVRSLAGAAT